MIHYMCANEKAETKRQERVSGARSPMQLQDRNCELRTRDAREVAKDNPVLRHFRPGAVAVFSLPVFSLP